MIAKSTTHLIIDNKRNTSCDYHRIILPFQHLKCTAKQPTYIFNRLPSIGLEALKGLKKQGYRIIMDIDDHFILPVDHYLYKSFKASRAVEKIIVCLRLADLVIVTTDLLAIEIKPFNKNTVVIPNALPFDQGQFTKNIEANKTPMVYACGASHRLDMELIKTVDHRHLTLAGYQSGNPEWIKVKSLFPNARYQLMLALDNYMTAYNGHQIALAPLKDSLFNSCKSNLKALEAGAKGLVLIASKVKPYLNKQDQQAVLYAEHKEDWRTITQKLIKDKILRTEASQKLAEHVRTHYELTKINLLRKQVLEC